MMDQNKRFWYLQTMGMQIWQLRSAPSVPDDNTTPTSQHEKPIAELTWEELQQQVAHCQRCDLHKTRTQTVLGAGCRQPHLLIVGEAPGANEDRQGQPFVGRAGQLLNAMLYAIKLTREEIFITNVLKSRPPNNRMPTVKEVTACTPFLLRQIVLLNPKLILALGKIAAQFLLNSNAALAKLRGQEFTYGPYHTPLWVTYHPAYLLRAPQEKGSAWEDLQKVAKRLAELR